MELLIQNTFWAGLAAMGFAILFNVPVRTLLMCAVIGAIGYAARVSLIQTGYFGLELSTLLAATIISFLGVILGRYWRVPALIFAVPAVIPLIPGSLAFRTMIDFLTLTTAQTQINETVLLGAVVNSIKTVLIVGAIAGGIAVPSLLLRRHQPMT